MMCSQAKALFSPYLDGMLPGTRMIALAEHLDACRACRQQYTSLRQTQQLLASAGKRKAPHDLQLKLRLAVSRELAQSARPFSVGLRLRVEHALHVFMVPATAGLASALLTFGFLMGVLALPLRAGQPDVPLMLNTAPQLEQSAFGSAADSIKDDSLVIEAYVDSNGRVEDYRILSSPDELKDLPPQVKNMLIFTTFRPATFMGLPTAGKAVLSFSKVSVRG
jgi:Putative zinc-finger